MNTPASPPDHLFAAFAAMVLNILTKAIAGSCGGRAAHATARAIARSLFDALAPRDALDAMLAARLVVSHCAIMDNYARAAQPGVSDGLAVRLRANAGSMSRSFDAALRALDRRRAPATRPLAAKSPAPARPLPVAAPKAERPIHIPGMPDAVMREPQRGGWRNTTSLTTPEACGVTARLVAAAAGSGGQHRHFGEAQRQ